MMGIFVTVWSRLPIEAFFVWLAVTCTTVILYEVVTLWQASGARRHGAVRRQRAQTAEGPDAAAPGGHPSAGLQGRCWASRDVRRGRQKRP
jgi:heme exporter protein D